LDVLGLDGDRAAQARVAATTAIRVIDLKTLWALIKHLLF
jgi:hypothetical protein